MRTDDNNNPTAFTTAIAENAKLVEGTDFEQGEPFISNGLTYYTAKLLGDPIEITKRVIDSIGFRTSNNYSRWTYINFPHFIWLSFTNQQKLDTIGFMYSQEGGTAMRHLFPNYGKV